MFGSVSGLERPVAFTTGMGQKKEIALCLEVSRVSSVWSDCQFLHSATRDAREGAEPTQKRVDSSPYPLFLTQAFQAGDTVGCQLAPYTE